MRINYLITIGAVICVAKVYSNVQTEKCGKIRKIKINKTDFLDRVFGGTELSSVEYPWIVALQNRLTRSFFCAGSLISSKHVLSGSFDF